MAGQAGASLVDCSLDQLADIVATAVSRQETRLAGSSGSIYIISGAGILRAPGATICGANVVNGVISFIAPAADDARGRLLVAAGGASARGALRYDGAHLLHRAHAEFGAAAMRQLFERAVLAKRALRFERADA